MVSLLELMFIGPAVTPKDICILRDCTICGRPVTPICLQILIPVISLGTWLNFWDAVPLDKEEFGLPSQDLVRISCESSSDLVQMQTYTV